MRPTLPLSAPALRAGRRLAPRLPFKHAGRLLAALALSAVLWVPARAEIGAYLLFDMESGDVIAQHNASTLWYPASLTKLMTAYVTFAAVESGALKMTSPVRISPQARQQPPSRMGFSLGTVITVETALRIILTKSANDVSLALAEAVGGTSGQFIDRMNATADRLGMGSSRYDNPHGLPNRKQVTTARDVAVLMRALVRDFPRYADYFEMGGVRLGSRTMRNHNKLIRRFRGADGMKTGFICSSGFNLAATAARDGVRLGAVVLGGLTSRERDERTAELLAKGFEAVKTGGRVRLDGFGDPHGRFDHAPVEGTRGDLGKVIELAAADGPAVDIRPQVCGARRPLTRYDDGVVNTLEELEALRSDYAAWDKIRSEREAARRKVLSRPRDVRPAPERPAAAVAPPQSAPSRGFAGSAMRPDAWESAVPVVFPIARPGREPAEPSDFAPEGWIASPARPQPNPLQVAGLREPLPPAPKQRPLSYLERSVAKAPVRIALGGADPSRPEPLSGTVVGGGKAPMPRPKPLVIAGGVAFEEISPAVTELATEVREAAGATR